MVTNAQALDLATQALKAGCILQVPAYNGSGTLTAGPHRTAIERSFWAVHGYFSRGRGNFSEEGYMPQDCARILLKWCGRGSLARVARKALEEKEGDPATCGQCLAVDVPRRKANALNVEVGTPLPRCRLKPPSSWKGGRMTHRWLASGGSPFVFGPCTPKSCPGRDS